MAFSWRRMLIRVFNWEYWPFHVVYGPIYGYWFWLCIKARSFFFFNTSNPGIKNGGFLMERKHEIYALLPKSTYPATVYCPLSASLSSITADLEVAKMAFPLIAKPDIGMRGLRVKLLQNAHELAAYAQESPVDFLLQAYVPYPEEAGIFYYRLPGETIGHISGIVGKEFLSVTGDGRSSVRTLLTQDSRFFLQLPALELMMPEDLDLVLDSGQVKTLVPYGNHARGAKFIDITPRGNPQLLSTINDICCRIPGFYFGRLDVKYNTWEELCAGEAFSIIEVNGAGSEPTHMYDPRHSLFFAWKEIIKHWKILYNISRLNAQQLGLQYMTVKEGLAMLSENRLQVKRIS